MIARSARPQANSTWRVAALTARSAALRSRRHPSWGAPSRQRRQWSKLYGRGRRSGLKRGRVARGGGDRNDSMAKAKRPQQRPQPQRATPSSANGANGASATRQPSAAKSAKPTTPAAQLASASRAAGSSRLASMRERTGTAAGAARGGSQRGRYAQQPWWRRNLGALVTVGVVITLVVAFLIAAQIQNQKASVGIGDPVPATVLKDVTSVSPTVAAKVGAGTAQNVFQATPKGTALLTANGKPEVVYVGADWCPYCAATRWSTVVALSRFGSFSGLTLMRSSNNDTLPNTSTFSFQHATYTSGYISFNATETADRNRNTLATP